MHAVPRRSIWIMWMAMNLGASPFEVKLIDAFAFVESGRAAKGIHERRNDGKTWGIYQFRKTRWNELGGDPKQWGKASAQEQTRVMLKGLNRYGNDLLSQLRKRGLQESMLSEEQFVIWNGRWHHQGHAVWQQRKNHTFFTRKLWKRFKRNRTVYKVAAEEYKKRKRK